MPTPKEETNTASFVCLRCAQGEMRRINRSGMVERTLLSALGYFPWECVLCRRKKFRHDNGRRRDVPARNLAGS